MCDHVLTDRYLLCFSMTRRPPRSTLFPTRRSSDLGAGGVSDPAGFLRGRGPRHRPGRTRTLGSPGQDRKSTRLNSSHITISYAVFCLKKKKHSEMISQVTTNNDNQL